MRNLYANFRKYLAPIGFCIVIVIQVACNSTTPEQNIQNFPTLTSQPLPTVIPPTQESPPLSYPDLVPTIPPGYPAPATEPEPIIIRPTFAPPPLCNIKPPSEITLFYNGADANSLSFSEPSIIASTEHWFSSGQWLPDNQRLLFTEEDSSFETIFTLNIETGERVEYAKRHNLSGSPIWLNEPEGVMFVEATTEGWDLRFTDGQKTEILAKELASVYLVKNPFQEQVAYSFSLEAGALMGIDPAGQTQLLTKTQFKTEINQIPIGSDDGYQLAWSPDGNWLIQYLREKVFLINLKTQEICSINLGDYGEGGGLGQIGNVQWSFESRYLSFFIKPEFSPLTQFHILDMKTMELTQLSFPAESSITAFGAYVWSPTQNIILLRAGNYDPEPTTRQSRWWLINPQSFEYVAVLPHYTSAFILGPIIWSSDGSKVVYPCPTKEQGHLCLLNISQ